MNASRELTTKKNEENDDDEFLDEFFKAGDRWECDRCECQGRYLIDLTFLELDDMVLLVCPECKDDLIVEGLLTFTAHTLFENVQHLPEG